MDPCVNLISTMLEINGVDDVTSYLLSKTKCPSERSTKLLVEEDRDMTSIAPHRTISRQTVDTVQSTEGPAERRLLPKYATRGPSKMLLITSIVIAIVAVIAAAAISTSAFKQMSSLKEELSEIKKEKAVQKLKPASTTLTLSQKIDMEIESIRRRLDEGLDNLTDQIENTASLWSNRLTRLEMVLANKTQWTRNNASLFFDRLRQLELDLVNKTRLIKNNANSLFSNLTRLEVDMVNNTQQIQNFGRRLRQSVHRQRDYDKEWFSCYHGGNVTHIINPFTGTCLYLGQKLVDWPTGQRQCGYSGGKLAVLHSIAELDWLTGFRRDNKTNSSWKEDFWVGLRDLDGWRWDGIVKGLVFVNDKIWEKANELLTTNQPSRIDGTTCGIMLYYFSTRISDKDCSSTALYLCEVGW